MEDRYNGELDRGDVLKIQNIFIPIRPAFVCLKMKCINRKLRVRNVSPTKFSLTSEENFVSAPNAIARKGLSFYPFKIKTRCLFLRTKACKMRHLVRSRPLKMRYRVAIVSNFNCPLIWVKSSVPNPTSLY